jgi:hypothetical protein
MTVYPKRNGAVHAAHRDGVASRNNAAAEEILRRRLLQRETLLLAWGPDEGEMVLLPIPGTVWLQIRGTFIIKLLQKGIDFAEVTRAGGG